MTLSYTTALNTLDWVSGTLNGMSGKLELRKEQMEKQKRDIDVK